MKQVLSSVKITKIVVKHTDRTAYFVPTHLGFELGWIIIGNMVAIIEGAYPVRAGCGAAGTDGKHHVSLGPLNELSQLVD